jgi:ankyrin repeat protein
MAEAEWMLRAVRRQPLEEVANLLDHQPALVHARGGVYRWTPLMSAAYEGRPDMLSLLLDRGAVADAVDRDGHTALHEAAMHGREDAVSLLLRRGADATIKSGTGVTALMRAAMSGHLAIVRVLLAHAGGRSTVDEKDYKGETALWKACAQGQLEVSKKKVD